MTTVQLGIEGLQGFLTHLLEHDGRYRSVRPVAASPGKLMKYATGPVDFIQVHLRLECLSTLALDSTNDVQEEVDQVVRDLHLLGAYPGRQQGIAPVRWVLPHQRSVFSSNPVPQVLDAAFGEPLEVNSVERELSEQLKLLGLVEKGLLTRFPWRGL